jgi:hypothetical protein
MNTREIATEYRLAHWANVMRERKESGLSIRAFCKVSGFHENIYYYWQRKLREAACTQMMQVSPAPAETAVAPGGWSVCSIAESDSRNEFTDVGTMTVEIGKFKIKINNSDDMNLFTKICQSLVSLC